MQAELWQYAGIKTINAGQGSSERFRLAISDTAHWCPAMLASQLNDFVKSGELTNGCLIQLNEYLPQLMGGKRYLQEFWFLHLHSCLDVQCIVQLPSSLLQAVRKSYATHLCIQNLQAGRWRIFLEGIVYCRVVIVLSLDMIGGAVDKMGDPKPYSGESVPATENGQSSNAASRNGAPQPRSSLHFSIISHFEFSIQWHHLC